MRQFKSKKDRWVNVLIFNERGEVWTADEQLGIMEGLLDGLRQRLLTEPR